MVCDDDDNGEGLQDLYTFGYRVFDYEFSTVRNAEEEILVPNRNQRSTNPAAPGIGKVHSSNRPCRRRYFDRSPGRKKETHGLFWGWGCPWF